jgi:hypothetical protein
MAGHLAIVAYRCLVGGVPTATLDVQVRWFADDDPQHVRRLIEADRLSSYSNSEGDVVCWELAQIFGIEPFSPKQSGEEIVGFIASTEEWSELA